MKSLRLVPVRLMLASIWLSVMTMVGGCQAQTTAAPLIPSTLAPTFTANLELTPTLKPTITPTITPTLPSTLAPTACRDTGIPEQACTGVTRNADWAPHTEKINGVLMALVPAGFFKMGSDSKDSADILAYPAHEVYLTKPFWLDVHEVTNGQFAEFGGRAERTSYWMATARPRELISWIEASAFCQKRGARLPTEAEWEYAARGPDGLVYPWGNDFVADNVVFYGNSDGHTWAVGSKPGGVSWVGVHDLSGNVWEWVADWYQAYPLERQVNPTGPDNSYGQVVVRGGSWIDDTDPLRATYRVWGYHNADRDYIRGFRCAISYEP